MTKGKIQPSEILKVDVSHLGLDTGDDKLEGVTEIYFRVNVYNEERGLMYGTFKLGNNRYMKGELSEERVLSVEDFYKWKEL